MNGHQCELVLLHEPLSLIQDWTAPFNLRSDIECRQIAVTGCSTPTPKRLEKLVYETVRGGQNACQH